MHGLHKKKTEVFFLDHLLYSQPTFTQSVIVRGSGFPLFATSVAVIKAAWREATVSLEEKNKYILLQHKYI